MWYYKEQSTDICYNMDKPWKHYAKWKKSDTEDHVIQAHLNEMSKTDRSIETKETSDCLRLRAVGRAIWE